jgi:tripartite-type tricarboxylate transporter receptor subunit TctC
MLRGMKEGMTIHHRAAFVAAVVFATCLVATAAQPQTASFPDRPVRLIVAFPAGGVTDVVARAVADRMQAAWKQPVVVENIVGATGAIGTAQAARGAPDGYTLLIGTGTTNTILPALRSNLQFDPINDFAPISLIARFPNMLVVHPGLPATNVRELVDLVTANPGKYTFASSGHGSSIHLAGELFKLMTGADILHIPYTGSAPAVTALLGGHVDMMFDTMPTVWPHAQSGQLRALGVASLQRTPLAPEVPAISEKIGRAHV